MNKNLDASCRLNPVWDTRVSNIHSTFLFFLTISCFILLLVYLSSLLFLYFSRVYEHHNYLLYFIVMYLHYHLQPLGLQYPPTK